MEIKLHTILVKDLIEGFEDNQEEGVVGYGGKLNIRPAFQREFVYNEKQQKEVINSIFKGFPLNVMYWVAKEDGQYELLDGQQRTLSICNYAEGAFFTVVDGALKAFGNLNDEQKRTFLEYKLQVYICEDGSDQERLDWFRIINIAGERLTNQELRNAIYTGPWLTSAKQRFSKSGCVAYKLGEKYMSGSPIRQEYLEKVLKWISGDKVDEYMAIRQREMNADKEWQYFQRVIAWVQSLFPNYRKEMKGVEWGELYNRYKDIDVDASLLEERIVELMIDDDVTNNKGIYEYVLSGNERALNLRAFTDKMKRAAYERQKGICTKCEGHFEIQEMEGDHITPWSKGGQTTAENCQMLCRDCNRRKSDI